MTEAQQRAYDQAQVMLAFSQGKKIEYRSKHVKSDWETAHDPLWRFENWDYRIAPEPQEVWLWVKDGNRRVVEQNGLDTEWLNSNGYTKKLFREVLDA